MLSTEVASALPIQSARTGSIPTSDSFSNSTPKSFRPVACIIKAITIVSYDASGVIFTTQLVAYI